MYPLDKGDKSFVAPTQMGHDEIEQLIAFATRYLTRTELKYDMLFTLVSITAWTVKKLCQYTMFTAELRIFFQ